MMLGGTKIKLEFFLGGDYKVYIGNYYTHVTILFDPKAPLALCILEQVFFLWFLTHSQCCMLIAYAINKTPVSIHNMYTNPNA